MENNPLAKVKKDCLQITSTNLQGSKERKSTTSSETSETFIKL